MDVRAALRHAAPWERRLYALISGGDESVDDWIRWHEELAEVSTSPDVELSRLILLGETRQTEALRAALDDWEGNDAAETRRKDWIAAAYLEPSLSRATGRALITEVRDELPAGWFADALVARLARRSGDAVARQQAESAIAARGSVLLRRWRALEAAGLLVGVAGLAALGLMLLTQADPRVADARMPDGFSLADGYALFVRGALGFLVLGAGFGPDDSRGQPARRRHGPGDHRAHPSVRRLVPALPRPVLRRGLRAPARPGSPRHRSPGSPSLSSGSSWRARA